MTLLKGVENTVRIIPHVFYFMNTFNISLPLIHFQMMPKYLYGLNIPQFIDHALQEDIGDGDHTSLATIPVDASGTAIVKIKEDGVVAGLIAADQIFIHVDETLVVNVLVNEGDVVSKGDIVIEIEGNVQSILKAERIVLNCMQRMSGIATATRTIVNLLEGTNAILLDTRKTTPNFRQFEKWAVQIGGGANHRFGLYDMILIKDNHVDASGGIETAIARANKYLVRTKKELKIEVETRSLQEVEEVLICGNIHRIMLDNFSIPDLCQAVKMVNGKYETEASGGITINNIRQVAESGVDFISMGALTHSVKSLDISLKITI
jgi:nicotinate-nucleotide pyrophosphorylase (carboxylating)